MSDCSQNIAQSNTNTGNIVGDTLVARQKLIVCGPISEGRRGTALQVESPIKFQENATFCKDAALLGDLDLTGDLEVCGNTHLKGELDVDEDAYFQKDVEICGDLTIKGCITGAEPGGKSIAIKQEDLPYVISEPGCYHLCENLEFNPAPIGGEGPVTKDDVQIAIKIEASNVHLDIGCHKLSQFVPEDPSEQVPFVCGIVIPNADPLNTDRDAVALQCITITGDKGSICNFSMYGLRIFAHTSDICVRGLTVKDCGHLASVALRPTVFGNEYVPHTEHMIFGFGPGFGVGGIAIGEAGSHGMGPEFFEDVVPVIDGPNDTAVWDGTLNKTFRVTLENVNSVNNYHTGLTYTRVCGLTAKCCHFDDTWSDDGGRDTRAIATSSVASGGTGYAPGDFGLISAPGQGPPAFADSGAFFAVDSVTPIDITTVADVAGSLGGTYFLMKTEGPPDAYVWFDTGGSTDPGTVSPELLFGFPGAFGIAVPITPGDADTVVATKMAAVLDALPFLSAPPPGGATVTVSGAGRPVDSDFIPPLQTGFSFVAIGAVLTFSVVDPGFKFNQPVPIICNAVNFADDAASGFTISVDTVTAGPPGYVCPLGLAGINASGRGVEHTFLHEVVDNNKNVVMTQCSSNGTSIRGDTTEAITGFAEPFGPLAMWDCGSDGGVYKCCNFNNTSLSYATVTIQHPILGYNGDAVKNQTFEECHFDNTYAIGDIIGWRIGSAGKSGHARECIFRKCTSNGGRSDVAAATPPINPDTSEDLLYLFGVEVNGGKNVLFEDCELKNWSSNGPVTAVQQFGGGVLHIGIGMVDGLNNDENVTIRRCTLEDWRNEAAPSPYQAPMVGILVGRTNPFFEPMDNMLVEDCKVSNFQNAPGQGGVSGFLEFVVDFGVFGPNKGTRVFRNCIASQIKGEAFDPSQFSATSGFATVGVIFPAAAQFIDCTAIDCNESGFRSQNAANALFHGCKSLNTKVSGAVETIQIGSTGGTGYSQFDVIEIDGGAARGVVLAEAAGVAVVVGLELRGSGYSTATDVPTTALNGGGSGLLLDIVAADFGDGFIIEGSDKTCLDHCKAKGNVNGINIDGSSRTTVKNCYLSNNDRAGVLDEAAPASSTLLLGNEAYCNSTADITNYSVCWPGTEPLDKGDLATFPATTNKYHNLSMKPDVRPETFVVDTVGATAAGLDGKYFTCDTSTAYYVWYDLDDGSVDPAPGGKTAIEVDIATGDDDVTIARKTRDTLNAVAGPEFVAYVFAGTKVVVSTTAPGDVTDAADVDTGMSVSVDTQGSP